MDRQKLWSTQDGVDELSELSLMWEKSDIAEQ